MKHKQIIVFLVIFWVVTLFLNASLAATVSPEEAAKLKTTLTPMGAEKAGNADGSIPAWTGGYTTVPAGFKAGDFRPDPFSAEKPLYSITGQNMDKYADKLIDCQKALLKKYPDYRIDVYPTHRTFAAPQFVYDNTFKNATRAKTIGTNGDNVEGAIGGTPFPIPKTGLEAMLNFFLAWRGKAFTTSFITYLVNPDGSKVMLSTCDEYSQYPYYLKEKPEDWNGMWREKIVIQTGPPYKAGESFCVHDNLNDFAQGFTTAWQYLPGQRRVRRAPSFSYDNPDFSTSGQTYMDECFMWSGPMDQYEWKLLGKKEMFVPYNCNKFYFQKCKDVLQKGHVNQDHLRWELHRVWLVEATLKPGKRNVVAKRLYYQDEDSWEVLAYNGWDGHGQLYRSIINIPMLCMDIPTVYGWTQISTNMLTGAYVGWGMLNEQDVQYKEVPPKPSKWFGPENLATEGVR